MIIREINIHRFFASKPLVRALVIIIHLPQAVLITPLLRTRKLHHVKQFLVIRPMRPLDKSVLPGTGPATLRMDQAQFIDHEPFEPRLPFRMGGEAHGEFGGVVGPDQKKGGSMSSARRKKAATVSERWSGRISEYFSRVRR